MSLKQGKPQPGMVAQFSITKRDGGRLVVKGEVKIVMDDHANIICEQTGMSCHFRFNDGGKYWDSKGNLLFEYNNKGGLI